METTILSWLLLALLFQSHWCSAIEKVLSKENNGFHQLPQLQALQGQMPRTLMKEEINLACHSTSKKIYILPLYARLSFSFAFALVIDKYVICPTTMMCLQAWITAPSLAKTGDGERVKSWMLRGRWTTKERVVVQLVEEEVNLRKDTVAEVPMFLVGHDLAIPVLRRGCNCYILPTYPPSLIFVRSLCPFSSIDLSGRGSIHLSIIRSVVY